MIAFVNVLLLIFLWINSKTKLKQISSFLLGTQE